MTDLYYDARLPARFWEKTKRLSSGCWEWGAGTGNGGYAKFRWEGRSRVGHKVAFEALIGSVPDGLQLDHLCRNRRCVNPLHLEPVTGRVNILRGVSLIAVNAAKTHCHKGHLLSGDNVYVYASDGRRLCRSCHRVTSLATYHRNK